MGLAIAFIFCLIFARLLYVQLIWGKELTFKASDQWNREIPVIAGRGIIADRNGEILAGNKTTYSVFLRPKAGKNKRRQGFGNNGCKTGSERER